MDDLDWFGYSVASPGDLDGDGVGDLVVGATSDDDGGNSRGAVWVLFLDGGTGCPADLDGRGAVDFGDILAILSAWGPCPERNRWDHGRTMLAPRAIER